MKAADNQLIRIPIIIWVVLTIFISASSSSSQVGLTKALDYDGDAKADLAVFRSNGTTWFASKDGIQETMIRQWGIAELDTLTPGDFDGDGKGDISVWRAFNGTFWLFRSSDSTFLTIQLGQPGDEPVARDYDGDGKTDCAVVRRQNDYLFWYILPSSTNWLIGYQYGANTDFPAPGDYDGDGRFDLAVQRSISNNGLQFWIQRSTDGLLVVQFGFDTDFFVPGDYDGDGKTDIALVRDLGAGSSFKWWIYRSSTSSEYVVSFGTGGEGDIPIQADYDGDGKTDIAIWRPSVRQFWISKSSNGQTSVYTYGSPGDLPVASYDTH